MLTTKEVKGVRVCHPHKPGKEFRKDGTPRHRRKIGKVFKSVFSPDGMRVVGFVVRRPDLLWMIKRPEKFLALDAMDIQDGVLVPTMGMDSWDDRAIKRLGVDWDTCILWEGIQVRTPDGVDLGYVDEIAFDETTGAIESLFLDDGNTARMLIGSIEIPAELMIGYKKGILIVKPEAAEATHSGGLAAKAGEASAKVNIETRERVHQVNEAATKATTDAIEATTTGIGKGIGRIKRSVKGAVEEYREESGANERAAAKKAAEEKAAKASASSSAKKASASSSSSSSAKSGAKKTSSGSSSAKASSSSSSSKAKKSASQAVSDHMEGVGSMWSNFKKEFDNAKK